MRKAKDDRFILLLLGVSLSVIFILSTVLTVVFLEAEEYTVMAVTLAVAVLSANGIPFPFFALSDVLLAIRIIPVYKACSPMTQDEKIEKISEEFRLKPVFVGKFLKKCVKRGYVKQ